MNGKNFKFLNCLHIYRTASFEDLAFLTADQALADIATLIGTVIADLEAVNPHVIVWGVGYGATLAVMARKKFPHLVHGVWASSGIFGARVVDTGKFKRVNVKAIISYLLQIIIILIRLLREPVRRNSILRLSWMCRTRSQRFWRFGIFDRQCWSWIPARTSSTMRPTRYYKWTRSGRTLVPLHWPYLAVHSCSKVSVIYT